MLDTIKAKAHGVVASLAAIGGTVIACLGLLAHGGTPSAHTAAVGVGGVLAGTSVLSFLKRAETVVADGVAAAHDFDHVIAQVQDFVNGLSQRVSEVDNSVGERIAQAFAAQRKAASADVKVDGATAAGGGGAPVATAAAEPATATDTAATAPVEVPAEVAATPEATVAQVTETDSTGAAVAAAQPVAVSGEASVSA